MSRMFQISEEDLAALEHTLPLLVDKLPPPIDNKTRVQLRRVQRVVTDVRWNYGPPGAGGKIIPAHSEDQDCL